MNDNYPPGVSGMEDEITGADVFMEHAVCQGCGQESETEVCYFTRVRIWDCEKCGFENEEEL